MGCGAVGPIHKGSKDGWSVSVEQLASSVVRTGSSSRLSLGRDARALLALGASAGAGICRIPVDRVPDGLEFGLDECDGGGLS